MAITTPSMGLKRWDQPNDVFSYTELSDNFAALDTHDHSPGKGVQIPTAGIVNLAVDTNKLANNAVTDAKVLAATITDAKLLSPSNLTWRPMFDATGFFTPATVTGAGVYIFNLDGTVFPAGVSSTGAKTALWASSTDYSVNGKSTQLRLRSLISTGSTASAVNFSPGFYPVTTVAGTPTAWTYTLGTVITNSTFTYTTPATNSGFTGNSNSFAMSTLPSNHLTTAVAVSGAMAANSSVQIHVWVEMRFV
jgi:hypothetical protein